MRVTIVFAAGIAAAGCASSGKLPPAGADAYGVYHFRQSVAEARPPMSIEGDIVLAPDTVIVSTNIAPCAYDVRARDARVFRYVCGSVMFTFDRYDPLRRNSYAARTTEIVSQRYCAATTMVNGVDRCSRYEQRRVSREVMRYGKLEPQRP